jgi:hypothetical protein
MPRPPQRWTTEELEQDRKTSCATFADRRRTEREQRDRTIAEDVPTYRSDFEDLLAATNNLRQITADSLGVRRLMRAARFVPVPFISDDDLDTLTGAKLKNWMKQTTERGSRPSELDFAAAAEVFIQQLDTFRAPWVRDDRDPTDEERERFLAGSITLRLNSRLASLRKSEAAARQEQAVRAAIEAAGYTEANPPQTITNVEQHLAEGSYARRPRVLAGASVDVPIRPRANHPTGLTFVALEAKDSNSEVNSRKRLIEVMEKATTWNAAGLPFGFRTAAVVSGCLPLNRLIEAQERGVLLFWEHRLDDLTLFLTG